MVVKLQEEHRFYALFNGQSVATKTMFGKGTKVSYCFYALFNGQSVATLKEGGANGADVVSMPFLTGSLLQRSRKIQ